MKLACKKVYVNRGKNSSEVESLSQLPQINEEEGSEKSNVEELNIVEEEIKFPKKKTQNIAPASKVVSKQSLSKPAPKPVQKSMLNTPGSLINNSLKNKSVKLVKKEETKSVKVPIPPMKRPLNPKITLEKPDISGLDANIVEICMEELSKQNAFATGEPIFCHNCNALFNFFSKITAIENSEQQKWICEFCEFENNVQIEPEEMPSQSKLVYVIESSEQVAEALQGPDDNSTIIFCIDISGSMCVTQPVTGRVQLKTSKLEELKKQFGKNQGPQYMPREHKNVTYVSRIECLQAAIEYQLTELQRGTPHRKIGIVTFNGEVNVIGDGTNELIISGDRLTNYDNIIDMMNNKHAELLGNCIGQSKEQLCNKVMALEENGPTALGPALLASVSLASQGGQGSKVIICTDGIANVGLGSLETDADIENADSFYSKISDLAKNNGVGVSVISIAGEECRLDCLSTIVEETGGDLTKVDPQNLSNDFANILSQQILAFNVTVTVNIHKALEYRNQESQYIHNTRLIKNLGSVTDDSLFTFEYSFKNTEFLDKIPFQVAVEHRKMNGMRCVLVDTQVIETTENQEEVMREADYEVLARNVQLQTAQLAKKGEYSKARMNVDKWQNYMQQNIVSNTQRNELKIMSEQVAPSYNLLIQQEDEDEVGMERNSKRVKKDALSVGLHKLSKKSKKF